MERYRILSGGVGSGGGAYAMPNNNSKATSPTVQMLIVLVILEYAAYLILRYVFRSVHGG